MNSNFLLETIRCEGGIAHHLEYHQQRLDKSLKTLGYSTTHKLSDLIAPPDNNLYRCRFLYDALQYQIEYHPYTPKKITSLKIIHDNTIDYSLKYANRSRLNELFAQRDQCDDILILKNGLVCDTSIANIAFLVEGEWLTPDTPLLEGTTRARLLHEGKIQTASIDLATALNAPKISLFNAMVGCFEIDNGIIQ